MNYIGIDGCKAGWFYIRLDKNHSYDFGVLNSIKELPQIANPESFICIDIPIGLREKDTQERLCDKEARKLLKKKGPSVFPAPSRLALDVGDYQTASELNFKFTGRKLSKQSYAISKKIKEVDDFIQAFEKQYHIRECHPELCFHALNDFEPLQFSKKKKEGRTEREEILSNYLSSASKIVKEISKKYLRKQVAIDDILDAMVASLTASFERHILTVPQQPEVDNKNLNMEIVYPYIPDEESQKVCISCVGDEYLKKEIKDGGKKGKCSYCEEINKCVSIKWLAEELHTVLSEHFYPTKDEWHREGDPVSYYLQVLPDIDEIIAEDIQEYLSNSYGYLAVVDGGEEDPYGDDVNYAEMGIDDFVVDFTWQDFCKQIKYRARYFNSYAEGILSELFGNLNTLETQDGASVIRTITKDDKDTLIFRARLCQTQGCIERILKSPTDELGPPPEQKASAGRMNPYGISVFYGATDIDTCIAETRPPVGSHIVLGQFDLLRDVVVLDFNLLQQIIVKSSLFDPEYKSMLEQVVFLENVVSELTKPIMPSQQDLEYIPTQVVSSYLSERIKPAIDGIFFRSSQSKNKGDNIILFNGCNKVKPYRLPKDSKVNVNMGWHTEDEYDDSITIFEEVPEKSEIPDNGEAQKGPGFFGFGNFSETFEETDYTLKLNLETIKVLRITGVSYTKDERYLSRVRTDKSGTKLITPTNDSSNPFE